MIVPLRWFAILGTISILSFLLFSFAAPITSEQDQISLSIHFPELAPPKGKILLRIQDKYQDTVHQKILTVSAARESYTCYLEAGSYAVAAFHDINGNEKLDRKWSGFPAEPYGFSNNVRGTMGPPDFEDQLFPLAEALEISINLK